MAEIKESTLLNYGNPPVVEAWMEFYLDLSEENFPWTKEYADDFIKENFTDYTPKDYNYFARINVNSQGEPDFSKTDKSFNRIRAFSTNGEYCIQVGRNVLIFNQINKGKWLGFDNMQNKAFDVLEKYLNYRKIDKLLKGCLHYLDVITIPSENGKITFEDYFKIYPKICDSFGDLWRAQLELVLPQSCKNGVTIFNLLQIPTKGSNFRFQIDWHIMPKEGFIVANVDSIRKWFNEVHLDLRNRFEDSFTDKTKKLFGEMK